MSRDSDMFHNFYYAQLDVIIEVISKWPDFERYTEKLRRLRNDMVEKGLQMLDPNPNHFNTLNHDDFWLKNVMVKVANAGASFENVIFIDFQNSCWASPAIDLHYLLNTSLCESLRPDYFNESIEYYHEQLSTTMRRMTFKQSVPAKEKFFSQFYARDFFAVNLLIFWSFSLLQNSI